MNRRIATACAGFLALAVGAEAADLPGSGVLLAAPCAGCHGTMGASPGKVTPVIGGQRSVYLKKTMGDFADGRRPGSVMALVARGYRPEQIDQIAAAFAGWRWVNSPHASGRTFASPPDEEGDCLECHGSDGRGSGARAPRLAGQSFTYLKEAMLEFRNGRRNDEAMKLLRDIVEQRLDELAAYYAGLR